jgi:hypothetical protein
VFKLQLVVCKEFTARMVPQLEGVGFEEDAKEEKEEGGEQGQQRQANQDGGLALAAARFGNMSSWHDR